MILGYDAIRLALRDGAIHCDPPPAHIGGVQIDVTLGPYSWVRRDMAQLVIHLHDADPQAMYEAREAYRGEVLFPARSFVLCHTVEYIGTTTPDLVPMLESRSTFARWGLSVHTSAGLGDPGYCSRWTLEVWNHHAEAIAVPVGARVGSVVFYEVQSAHGLYEGRYNVGPAEWSPLAMLPRKANW